MRFQMILLFFFISLNTFASDDQEIKLLLSHYSEITRQHKVTLIENVFTQKFLHENGGKNEFEKKVKSQPLSKIKDSFTWKKGVKENLYFAQLKPNADSQFIIVKENGKWKINGTINDAN